MKVAWAEADGELVFSVSYEFDWLTPTDCVGVYLRDTVRRMRIEKIERADGVLKLTGKSDRQSAYTSNVTGIPLPAPTPPPPTIAGPTQFSFLNLPALVDNHDILGYYVAGVGQTPAWYGAEVQESVAGGDFEAVAQIPQGGTMGYLLEAVADASEHYPDTTNTLLVQLYSGEFESVSQEQLLRENNGLALVRSDGTAEIVQFRDAEDLGAGVWRLSYLIRGRLNSGTDSHAVNAKVVLLNGVQLVPTDATMIGVDITHRAVSYGESPEEAAEVVHTFDPVLIQTEFPVDLLELSLDGTNLTAIWSPRERFGTDVNPIRSVNWQNYRVTATDGSATITVDTTSPSAILDVSTLSGNITVTVYQVNRITGAGPGVSATI